MYEDAQRYLARVFPWPSGGDTLYANIHNTYKGEGWAKPSLSGMATTALKDAVYWAGRGATTDVYLCMSSQRLCETKTGKSGKPYHSAIRGRDNAVTIKALYVDCDFKGGDHGYASQAEATKELARFLKEASLPKPTIVVHSGNGFHIYWLLAAPITIGDWQPLADALVNATRKHNFKCDTQVTVDAVRLLRIPDTNNFKTDPPKPVKLLFDTGNDYTYEALDRALTPYKGARTHNSSYAAPTQKLDPTIFPPRAPLKENDLAAGREERENIDFSLEDVAEECPWVGEALTTGGRKFNQPQWNLTTLLATFSEGKNTDAHRMGNQHPTYTKDSTDAMYARKVRERGDTLGWPTCQAIRSAGGKHCDTCKYLAVGRTPVHAVLGRRAQAAVQPPTQSGVPTQVDADLPEGYQRQPDGVVVRRVANKTDPNTTDFQPVAPGSMEDPSIQMDPVPTLTFRTNQHRLGRREINIKFADIGSMGMRPHLQAQGFLLSHGPNSLSMVSNFMNAWIDKLRKTKDSISSVSFGWQPKGSTQPGFVFGGSVWMEPQNGSAASSPAIPSDPVLRSWYEPKGDINVWKQAAKMITDQQRPALDAILASAFGAPLVEFSGEAGTVFSAYSSESGLGKSTALKVAQAVWGHSRLAMQMLDDTANNAMNKLGKLRSLPMYWDELKSEAQLRKYVELVFTVSQGREKGRMTRDITLREPGQWRTLFLSCNNESLLDHVMHKTPTTTAGLYRVFEFEVERGTIGQIVPSAAGILTASLEANHSSVGLEYARYLGGNRSVIEKEVADTLEASYKELGAQGDERFWVVGIAALLLGAKYANQLGFTQINEETLKAFLASALHKLRANIRQQPVDLTREINLSNAIAGFYAAAQNKHVVFTNRIHVGQGAPTAGAVKINYARTDEKRVDGVWIQAGMDDGLIRISITALKKWLSDMKISPTAVMKGLKEKYQARTLQGRMCAGTALATPKEYIVEFNTADADDLNFING